VRDPEYTGRHLYENGDRCSYCGKDTEDDECTGGDKDSWERIAELEAEAERLHSIHLKGCDCSSGEACAFARERDDALAKADRLQADLVTIGAAADIAEWAVREYGLAGLPDTIAQWRGDAAQAEALKAKLARYEAPGPALLVAEHYSDCSRDAFTECDCEARPIDAAYREQHARCVAVVERVEREALVAVDSLGAREWQTRQEQHATERAILAETQFLAGVRACLAALKDGAK
jgi:hypothetical protein